MSLFKRGKLPNGRTYSEENKSGEGLSFLLRDNPLSSHFNPRVGDKPSDLKNYLRALQMKQYSCSIELDDRVLIRNFKLLLKEFTPMLIKRGIKYASQTSDYPFSTKYVREMIEQVKDQL